MRVLSFILIVCISFVCPWWALAPIWLAYAVRHSAYELIVLGCMLDAYFGATFFHATYTAMAVVVCVGMEWLRPRIALSL